MTGGLAGTETATLREILDILQRAYCGKVGTEYRHIQSKDEKLWLREQIRRRTPTEKDGNKQRGAPGHQWLMTLAATTPRAISRR